MKLNEIRVSGGPPKPEWKLDIDNKVYIVYDENGKEVERHEFKQVWDSSPARDKAQATVVRLRADAFNKNREKSLADAEAKPLSDLEKEFIELSAKFKQYVVDAKNGKPIDEVEYERVNKRMDRLLSHEAILRKSVRNGTRTS